MSGDLLVITSCTATKLETPDGKPRVAESLYAGQQHIRLMRGVKAYRDADEPAGPLRFKILSAFYGLLKSRARVKTYDHTFAGQPTAVIHSMGQAKDVPKAIRKELTKDFEAGMLLLGDPYLRACDLDDHIKLGGPLISFCSPAVARRMPKIAGLRTISLTNAEARRFSVGLVAIKGELAGRALTRLGAEPGEVRNLQSPRSDVLGWLEAAPRITWSEAPDVRRQAA